jgi:hypothetical protein
MTSTSDLALWWRGTVVGFEEAPSLLEALKGLHPSIS